MFLRGTVFWCQDNDTAKQETLRTKDRATAERLLHAKNEAHQQPIVNLQIARAYLQAGDPAVVSRNWQAVMEEMTKLKRGETQTRYVAANRTTRKVKGKNAPETFNAHDLKQLDTVVHLARTWIIAQLVKLPKNPGKFLAFRLKRVIISREVMRRLTDDDIAWYLKSHAFGCTGWNTPTLMTRPKSRTSASPRVGSFLLGTESMPTRRDLTHSSDADKPCFPLTRYNSGLAPVL